MLCDRGINVNAVNHEGDTCLNLCVKNGAKENIRIIQKLLFDFKANPDISNIENENFYSLMEKEANRQNINLNEINLTNDLYGINNNSNDFQKPYLFAENINMNNKNSEFSKYLFYYLIGFIIVVISKLIIKYR